MRKRRLQRGPVFLAPPEPIRSQYEHLSAFLPGIVDYDVPIWFQDDQEEGGSKGDNLTASDDPTPEENLLLERRRQVLVRALCKLTKREQMILLWRVSGETQEEGDTLQIIGDRLGLCRERIRQIEKQALARLRTLLTDPEKGARNV